MAEYTLSCCPVLNLEAEVAVTKMVVDDTDIFCVRKTGVGTQNNYPGTRVLALSRDAAVKLVKELERHLHAKRGKEAM